MNFGRSRRTHTQEPPNISDRELEDDVSLRDPVVTAAIHDIMGSTRPIDDAKLKALNQRAWFEERLVGMGAPRPPSSYKYSWLEDLKIRFYEHRVDRSLSFATGILVIIAGTATMWVPDALPLATLVGGLIFVGGLILASIAVQSGRIGYLEQRNLNRIEDIGASLPASIIRGHHAVHEAEADLVRTAIENSARNILVGDLWFRQRNTRETPQFAQLLDELHKYAIEKDSFGGRLTTVLSATKGDLDYCSSLMDKRLGRARQVFYFENPLQLDFILSDDEVILSFPRQGSARDFALRFQSPAVVCEFWDIFKGQLFGRRDVEASTVESEEDVYTIKNRIASSREDSFEPISWRQPGPATTQQ